MPGSTPATSQLDWLSSTTAMIVLSWSKATRDLLKACPSEGRGRSAGASGHSISWLQRRWCHFLTAYPIPSLRWREKDSNHRSPVRESTLFETAGFERWQIIRPADEHHARLGAGPCSRGTDGSQTPRWREMDSNFRFRARRNQEISVSRWSSTDLVYGTVARISAQPSGRHAREQYRADKCPVDGEGPSREALEDAQKAPDRDKGREAADNEADGEHQPAVRIEAGVT